MGQMKRVGCSSPCGGAISRGEMLLSHLLVVSFYPMSRNTRNRVGDS